MGKRMRFIRGIVLSNYRTWLTSPRILTIVGMVICLSMLCVLPFAENARVQAQALQIGEAFIALMNWRFSLLLLSSAAILLFGDLPIISRYTQNMLMQGTRFQWYTGQFIYVLLTSVGFTLLLFLTAWMASGFGGVLTNEWSRPVKLMALSNQVAVPELRLIMSRYIVMNYSPWQATIINAILFTLMTQAYGVISILLRLCRRSGGLIILLVFNLASWSVSALNPYGKAYGVVSILSLHYHASLSRHEMQSVNALLPSVQVSMAIMLLLIFLAALLSLLWLRRYDFTDLEERH